MNELEKKEYNKKYSELNKEKLKLYKKEWIKNNKPEVKFVTGYISSKESYNSRIKSLGDPSYIRPRDSRKPGNYKHEEIVESLSPSMYTTQGGSYDYDNQVEVRHDIKD